MVGGELDPAAGVEEIVPACPVGEPGALHYQVLAQSVRGEDNAGLGLRWETQAVAVQLLHVDDGGSHWELEERGEDYLPAELNTHQGVSFPQQVVASCLRVQEVGGVDESHVAVLLVRQCRGWLLGELTQE